MAAPLLGTIFLGFFKWSGFNFKEIQWIGLGNYFEIIHDSVFWIALRNNLKLISTVVPLQCGLGLAIAILLEKRIRFSTFFRGVYFLPSVIPIVVTGIIFTMLLNPSFGFGSLFGGLSLPKYLSNFFTHDWLGNPNTALYVIIFLQIWTYFGYSMFLFISKLKTIPNEIYEAATVDGATQRDKTWYITIPLLKDTIGLVIILASIDVMKLFTVVFVITYGGPNYSTEVLAMWSYFQAFQANHVGYGSALASVLLVISLILTAIQLKLIRSVETAGKI